MDSRKLWILVALFLAGCGGSSNEPTAAGDGVTGTETEAAAADAVPVPEVVESLADGEQSPTSDKFRLGVEYARLSPTQPTRWRTGLATSATRPSTPSATRPMRSSNSSNRAA